MKATHIFSVSAIATTLQNDTAVGGIVGHETSKSKSNGRVRKIPSVCSRSHIPRGLHRSIILILSCATLPLRLFAPV